MTCSAQTIEEVAAKPGDFAASFSLAAARRTKQVGSELHPESCTCLVSRAASRFLQTMANQLQQAFFRAVCIFAPGRLLEQTLEAIRNLTEHDWDMGKSTGEGYSILQGAFPRSGTATGKRQRKPRANARIEGWWPGSRPAVACMNCCKMTCPCRSPASWYTTIRGLFDYSTSLKYLAHTIARMFQRPRKCRTTPMCCKH